MQELVKRITRKEKEAVHEFVYARGTRELLHVRWDGNEYWLESASGLYPASVLCLLYSKNDITLGGDSSTHVLLHRSHIHDIKRACILAAYVLSCWLIDALSNKKNIRTVQCEICRGRFIWY